MPKLREETTIESLKCVLTDREKLELGEKQAKDFAELERLADRLKDVTSQIKSQMKEVEARLKATAETIRNGYQYRDVDVIKVIGFETVKYYRGDTGECYRERALMPSERQMVLEVTKGAATAAIEKAFEQTPPVTAKDLSPEDFEGEEAVSYTHLR
ncbi:MAG: hypothetical protein QUS09_05625, partial [Methanotrichaceae archaeon]|nr:hypothetical protein [Methanotrichaceae archaeon]